MSITVVVNCRSMSMSVVVIDSFSRPSNDETAGSQGYDAGLDYPAASIVSGFDPGHGPVCCPRCSFGEQTEPLPIQLGSRGELVFAQVNGHDALPSVNV